MVSSEAVAPTGSSSLVTVALFVTVPSGAAASTVNARLTDSTPPGAIKPRSHSMVPRLSMQLADELSGSKISPLGGVSVMVTPSASDGPLLPASSV